MQSCIGCCGKRLVTVVAIHYNQLREIFGCMCDLYKVFKPLKKQLSIRPARWTAITNGICSSSPHQLINHSLSWENEHWWNESPCSIHCANDSRVLSTFTTCHFTYLRYTFGGQNSVRLLHSCYPRFIYIPDATCCVGIVVEDVLVDRKEVLHLLSIKSNST